MLWEDCAQALAMREELHAAWGPLEVYIVNIVYVGKFVA